MKAILEIHDADIVAECRAWLAAQQADHEQYYARHRHVVAGGRIFIGPELPDRTYHASYGYRDIPNGGRWITSGNNYTAIQFIDDLVIVWLDGRRAGLRFPFSVDDLVISHEDYQDWSIMRGETCVGHVIGYETQRRDVAPWGMMDPDRIGVA